MAQKASKASMFGGWGGKGERKRESIGLYCSLSMISHIKITLIPRFVTLFSFFVVEDHILHATQGLITRAYTDELWNMALSKIIAVLRTHSVSEPGFFGGGKLPIKFIYLRPRRVVFRGRRMRGRLVVVVQNGSLTWRGWGGVLVIKNCSDLGEIPSSLCLSLQYQALSHSPGRSA